MATAIQFLRSSISGLRPAPTALSEGMPMVNINASDPGLYLALNDQTLMKVGPTQVSDNPPNYNGPGFGGNSKGEMWLDTTLSSGVKPRAVLKTWDGGKWVETGGAIRADELAQEPNTFLAGPVVGPANVPTFREMDFDDLPDSIPLTKLQGGKTPGSLIIGGSAGWGEDLLGLGDDSLTATVGDNTLTLEVTAGNIAGLGPDGTIKSGDGHVQFNYDGVYSADNRFKFKREDNGILQAHTSTEFGENQANHSHTFVGDTSFTGEVTIENVHSLTVGGDFFVGHNAQIGSDPLELLAVFSKTEFNSDVAIKDFNNLDVGGNAFVHRNTVLGEADTNILTVAATSTFLSSMTVGRGCDSGDVLTVDAAATFECDVTVKGDLITGGTAEFPGDAILGSDCGDFIKVQGTQLNNCDIFVGTNVPDANAQQLTIEAATGNLTTKGEIFVTEKLTVSDPLTATPAKFVVDGSTGNVDTEGTVTAGFFSGDGSQLFNLAVPNSMLFRGDINATIPGQVPTGGNPGDFWLNNTTGTVDAAWPDIGGQPIQQDQFIYYAQTGPATFAWSLGSIQNNQGFVTINTAQDVNGSKSFQAPTFFDENIEVRGLKSTLLTGTLTVKQPTQLDETLTVDDGKATLLGGTLTVKENTELRGDLVVIDGENTQLGGDLTVKQDSFFGSGCSDLFQVNAAASFLCGLEIGSSGSPCTGAFNIYSDTTIACDTTVEKNLTVANNTLIGSGCINTFTVNASTSISCPTTVSNTLTVSGNFDTSLGGTLTVTGAASLNNTVDVTGTTTLNGLLRALDNSYFAGEVEVVGSVELGSSLSVSGTSSFASPVTVASTVDITGATKVTGTFTVADGNPSVLGGTLTVKGLASFTSSAANALVITGKGRSASTTTSDTATTLATKDYVDQFGQWEINGSTLRPRSAGKHVVPRSDGNANLGSTSLRWANVYTQDMHFSNEGTEGNSVDGTTGDWTLQEGHDHLYFINNKTGAKFRVVMEQV